MSLAEHDQIGLADHRPSGLTDDDLRSLYYYMQLTRSLEDRVRSLYLQGKLVGAVYSSRGQEGTAVGSAYALREGDFVAPLIRDLGASLVRGVKPAHIFAQWLGRAGGPTGGRDGNLHFGEMSVGVLPPISMLGASIPLCCGIALAGKQRGDDLVALTYIGDGGTNTGDFHEGMNFAAALKLGVVVIAEDNGFAYSTPTRAHLAVDRLADRAAAYGVPSQTVDGNDIIAVYVATRASVERARRGGGPTLLEVKTFRMRGHAEHDNASYVPKDLIEYWAARDPIDRLLRAMAERGVLDEDGKLAIDARIAAELHDALAWAEASSFPDGAFQVQGVFAP
jgi:TPP-dependent pyruvate/acetoin dehydrogenase alpha subunit